MRGSQNLFRICLKISLLSLFLFAPKGAWSLTTATVAGSLTATPVCPVFDGGNLDYAAKASSGIKIYSGALDTASWAVVGTAGADGFSRNVKCSRDSAGTTHSVYNRFGVPSSGNFIKYVSHTTAGVPSAAATVDTTHANATPLAAMHDDSDNFYVLFSSGNNYHLAYRDNASALWTTYDIDTSGTISSADMVLVNNLPVVALYESSNDDVIISRADATLAVWTTETATSTGIVGDSLSLDADTSGNLYLFYHVSNGGSYYSLEYTTNASGAWISESVDTSNTYIYDTDIEVVSPNIIAAAAYSNSLRSIVYFTRTTSGWGAAQTVAAASYQFLDLGTDNGDVAISYFDSSNNLNVSYSLCGDSSQSDFEECDDGNNTNGDGCDEACVVEIQCGNGNIDLGEDCDDANGIETDSCTSSCIAARCGDNLIWSTDGGTETCDDGNTVPDDGCSTTCQTEVCGDGIPQGTEACDDGNTDNTDGCSDTCATASCGDGYVQLGEDCDDANSDNTDSCIQILNPDGSHYDCRSATCGDGQIWSIDGGTEACDDGNMNNKDGCGSDCQIEHAPTADAGADQTVSWPGGPAPTITMSGIATDADTSAVLTYRWIFSSKPAGSALTNASLTGRTTLTPSFRPDMIGVYTLRLTVIDNVFYTANDTAVVTVTR